MSSRDDAKRQLESWTPRAEMAPGPFKVEADQLNDLLSGRKKRLQRVTYGGSEVVVTPEVYFNSIGASGQAYFFKDAKNYSSPDASIFGYLKKNTPKGAQAEEYRFSIDPNSGILTDVDTLHELSLSPLLLRSAIDATRSQLAREDQQRQESWRHRRNRLIASVAALAVAGGIYEGIDSIIQSSNAAARRAALARRAFDATDFTLPGNIVVGAVNILNISPAEFKKIPGYKKHDSLLDARKFKLDEESCKTFDTRVTADETVAIVTSKTDLLQNQPVVAGVDGQHRLVVCSTHSYPDKHNSWSLAVQLKK